MGNCPRDSGPGGQYMGLYLYPVGNCLQWRVVLEPISIIIASIESKLFLRLDKSCSKPLIDM